ncbi:hypothetical protein Athai_46450 [Actinocatenispora thailandica]|uniref:DUF4194 domain-containing protein n=1 Tax=Actinocatenispora thailandica TaxID=227318 RepID=A0A7R7DT92_9ACTN|nr:DUF4194 domain-containing protein [Actinocatenispora thailandica]BCJ37142.1 hypothetical protein Athai_46450 [Actinocatenispora thailandica]
MNHDPDLGLVVTHMMKGVVYRDGQPEVWRALLRLRTQAHDHVGVLGLRIDIDEAEGYAFLRSRPQGDDEAALPRLVARRSLSFHVSLLVALLRKKLAEFDAANSDTRLILTRQQIVESVSIFLPPGSSEARLIDQIDTHIGKVVELGFLRKVTGTEHSYEVRRIIKAFVDAQWLFELDERLREYARQLAPDGEGEA